MKSGLRAGMGACPEDGESIGGEWRTATIFFDASCVYRMKIRLAIAATTFTVTAFPRL